MVLVAAGLPLLSFALVRMAAAAAAEVETVTPDAF